MPLRRAALALVALLTFAAPASACVGANCMLIWSTADGGGALTIEWDFVNRGVLQTFPFCTGGDCLYNTSDPGFMALDETPDPGFFTLAAGTDVTLEIVAIDDAATLKINGTNLSNVGDRVLLGAAGTLHVHPTWQLSLPEGVVGDFGLSFKLTTTSPSYAESAVFTVQLTSRPPPPTATPTIGAPSTPTPTATAAPAICAGDCDGDDTVTVAELIAGVASVLNSTTPCAALDRNGDGVAVVGEMVAAVNALLNGCPATPTPTETPAATLDVIQATIFSPRCAIPTCHDAAIASGSLVLTDAQTSFDNLVGVDPLIEAARLAGMKRVDASHPENSFLITKLLGPPPGQGSRMPLTGAALSNAEVQLIRTWIADGAVR